ncbi:MAG: exosortase C-terminal domain/associated protein EpsI [Gemmatimonadales bacterium]
MGNIRPWLPGSVLSVGCIVTLFINHQKEVPLARPLETIPVEIAGYRGTDYPISEAEQKVAGMDAYLFRGYTRDSAIAFTTYVGYYDHQTQGRTIHSPKNCLPGSGWEALAQSTVVVPTPGGPEQINRYLLQNKNQRALVYYWYQGRGRVAANEYRVKWELLRDAALEGRSEEALVRIVVPITDSVNEAAAGRLATAAATQLIPAVYRVLPE